MAFRRSVAGILVIGALVFAASATALLHTDKRAAAVCGHKAFSVSSPSLWPPGARCFGGQPTFEEGVFDGLYLFVALVVGLGFYGAYIVTRPRAGGMSAR